MWALGGAGGGLLAGGALVLALPTDYETLPQEFRAMPSLMQEEMAVKILRGEGYLGDLAVRAHVYRIFGGMILMGGGAVWALV